jgi:hypothetical protein
MIKRKLETLDIAIINRTMVDPDLAMSKRKILSENIVKSPTGQDLYTVRYQQCLQSCSMGGSKLVNWNGRSYPLDLITGGIKNNPIIQHELSNGTWTAEYGHPYEPNKEAAMARQNTIDPKTASNTIKKWWVDGNLIMAECETLAGEWGDVLAKRILTGYPAMASLRSIGRMKGDGEVAPQGFWIITYDTVTRPSHKEAMQKGGANILTPSSHTMNESVTTIKTGGNDVASFILQESHRDIEMISAIHRLNMDTMRIEGDNILLDRMSSDGLQLETVIIPIKVIMGASYHQLF